MIEQQKVVNGDEKMSTSSSDQKYIIRLPSPLLLLISCAAIIGSFSAGYSHRFNSIEFEKLFFSPSENVAQCNSNLLQYETKDVNGTTGSDIIWGVIAEDEEDYDDEESDEEDSDDEESDDEDSDDEDSDDDGPQQIQIDFVHLDSTRIRSAGQLGEIILMVANKCDLSVRRYTCQSSTTKSGASCVALLKDGHIFLQSWPSIGDIALDIFITDPDSSLEPFKLMLKNLFEQFRDPTYSKRGLESTIISAHAQRRRAATGKTHTDLDGYKDEMMGYMEKVVSVRSPFQQIDIYDDFDPILEASILSALKKDPEYLANNPELFQPDRTIFLDGVMQSRRNHNEAYHESLVQPAMFTHPNPKRVAIIGGGECATLREVLKHNTIEKVVMIEIDQVVMDVSQEHLPTWNDCSNLEGSTRYCVDDPRAEVYAKDAFKWFIDRFAEDTGEPPFDVIIMDALDPQNVVEFAGVLYGNDVFLKSLYNGLTPDGILISQVGESNQLNDPSEMNSKDKNRYIYIDSLAKLGFESMLTYDESHCGFYDPWSYVVALKSRKLKATWYEDEAYFNLAMKKRSVKTVNGESPFAYFDGATMREYQSPAKAVETVFCRTIPTPKGCEGRGFDPETPNVPVSALEVSESKLGRIARRGIFTTVDIPAGSHIALDAEVHALRFKPHTYRLLYTLEANEVYEAALPAKINDFMENYGYTSEVLGDIELRVSPGITKFMNHGCHGTFNVGVKSNVTEETADPEVFGDEFAIVGHPYNPAIQRDSGKLLISTSHRELKKGEELLDNFLAYNIDLQEWAAYVPQLRSNCEEILADDAIVT